MLEFIKDRRLLVPIAIIILVLLTVPMREGFNSAISYFIDLIWTQSPPTWSRLHKYNNTCLTTRPYGNSGSQGPLDNWAKREKYMQQEYASCGAYRCGDISGLKDNEPMSVRNLRRIKVDSIPAEYYHNPADFCAAHPDRYPCPNHWLNGKYQSAADSRLDHKILPGLKKGLSTHIKDTQVDDNYRTLVLYPETEDHGKC